MSGRYQPDEYEMNAIRQEVMEFAGIGLYRYAFDGTIIFIDRGTLRIFELDKLYPDPAVLIGRKIEELFVYVGPPRRIRDELRVHPQVRDFEYPFKTLSGKHKWVLHDSYLITDPITGEELIQATIRDITERKQAQEALRVAEEQYRSIFENAALGIYQATVAGKILNCNPAFAHIFGYDTPEEVKAAITDVGAQLYVEPAKRKEVVEYTLTHPGMSRFETHYRRKDGHIIIANMAVRMVHDTTGQPLYLEGFVEDVTEQREAVEALETERSFLSSTIDILPLPLLFLSREGQVMRMNTACQHLFAERHLEHWEDAIWKSADTRTIIPHEQWPSTRSLRTGEIISSQEGVMVFPDGREVSMLLYTAPVLVGNNLVAAVVALQDVSALKAADRAKTEFLGVLSHELKTPLTGILGWAQLALSTTEESIITEALHIIERNARRQREILDDLIDVSRLIHGRLVIKPEASDLWVLAVEAYAAIEPEAHTRELALVLEAPGVELPVLVDIRRIRQVIGDLLTNALKFTPAKGVITISGHREEDWAVLSIQDTGRGIPREFLPTLFKPFQQVERSEVTGGMGLGLTLVYGILELHGGQVAAASAGLDQGSTFTIRLPLRKG